MLNALRSVAEIEKQVTNTSSVPVERFVAASHKAYSALKQARLLAEGRDRPTESGASHAGIWKRASTHDRY
jgi:hypothetical protein